MKLPSIPRKILSIDFGAKDIKLIEGKCTKKNIQIFQGISIPVEPYFYKDGEIKDKDMLSTLIAEIIKENKITTNLVYAIINSSQIITREISIPKIDLKDIDDLIRYQLNDFLPIDREEYDVKYIYLGNKTEEKIEKINILLIGMPKSIIINHLNLIKDLNLKPTILDYQGNALAKLFKYNKVINEFYDTEDLTIASIDIGYSNTKLNIIKNGKIELSRIIDLGAETLYENILSLFDDSYEEIEKKLKGIKDISILRDEFTDYYRLNNIVRTTLTTLIEDIEIIFRYYNSKEVENQINCILLQGGLSNIDGVDNLFSNYFNIPVIKLSNLDKVKWAGDLNKFSNAIGGLVRFNEVIK